MARSKVNWLRVTPFFALHLACFAVIWVGWSWMSVATAVAIYFARVFGLTAFYHRYFSHRTFKTSRTVQFLGALLGNSAGQRGPIWWSAHHRLHHQHSDTANDVHSPNQQGFCYSHMLWFMTHEHYFTPRKYVKDWLRYPELRLIDRFDFVAPMLLATSVFLFGSVLQRYAPELNVNGPQMFVWGFVLSTVALYHVTFCINSLAHRFGQRRFPTNDDSRNNFLLAMVTMGEGWHNNHHYYPNSVRQGFYWWEVDLTYYLLRAMAWCGIIWDLNVVPNHVLVVESRPTTDRQRF
ncbi:MAG: acyl-CoA desaturase [Pirellulales bacterium]